MNELNELIGLGIGMKLLRDAKALENLNVCSNSKLG